MTIDTMTSGSDDVMCGDAIINVTLNNVMMQLRKCCNHPYLISYPLVPTTNQLQVRSRFYDVIISSTPFRSIRR